MLVVNGYNQPEIDKNDTWTIFNLLKESKSNRFYNTQVISVQFEFNIDFLVVFLKVLMLSGVIT